MRRDALERYFFLGIFFFFSAVFAVRFAAPSVLRMYVEAGIGNCVKIPILCMSPENTVFEPEINKDFAAEFTQHKSVKLEIRVPKGFSVVEEKVKKVYYKKKKHSETESVIFLLHLDPDFFVNLYPRMKKQGVISDYEFIKRTMYAKPSEIKGLTDAFFVIMKGVFIPDLGDQKKASMAEFRIDGKRAFINYSLEQESNYFDCNVISSDGFLKLYIKDKERVLDLDRVLAIIQTAKRVN